MRCSRCWIVRTLGALLVASACTSNPAATGPAGENPTTSSSSERVDSSGPETTLATSDTTEPELAVESGRLACAGLYTGTYGGDDFGPFILEITEAGELRNAFVTQESLGTDAADEAEFALALEELDLTFGIDVIVTGARVEIAPSALRVGPSGPQLGTLPIELDRIGSVDAEGQVTATAQGGADVTGVFDWSTCTATGTWTNDDLAGPWQVGLNPSSLNLETSDCVDGRYVGADIDQDDLAVDLDAACISAGLISVEAEAIGDGIQVAETEGYTGYTLTGAVLFDFGATQLSDSAFDALRSVAVAILSERGPGASVLIIGHTDSIGSDAANLALSQRRAENVLVALKSLLSDATFDVASLGEYQPISPNANPDGSDAPAGRMRNRRVEIVVVLDQ